MTTDRRLTVGLAQIAPVLLDREATRQSFDPAGHCARPDVLRLHLDRRRQRAIEDTM